MYRVRVLWGTGIRDRQSPKLGSISVVENQEKPFYHFSPCLSLLHSPFYLLAQFSPKASFPLSNMPSQLLCLPSCWFFTRLPPAPHSIQWRFPLILETTSNLLSFATTPASALTLISAIFRGKVRLAVFVRPWAHHFLSMVTLWAIYVIWGRSYKDLSSILPIS